MTPGAQSLLAELDTAVAGGSDAWRGAALRRIADLFLSAADVYGADQVALFGEVMVRLADNADRLSLAELSGRLAPIARAPLNVLRSLARHADIAVCGPVLEQAAALRTSSRSATRTRQTRTS